MVFHAVDAANGQSASPLSASPRTRTRNARSTASRSRGDEEDLAALVRHYIELEASHDAEKQDTKKRKRADNDAQSRAMRPPLAVEPGSDDESVSASPSDSQEDQESSGSGNKRRNAFMQEAYWQHKRHCLELQLKEKELVAQQQQFEARLTFEERQAQARLASEERAQELNRQLILECAKLISSALSQNRT
ncbi:hypothetical protein FI667_g4276, partial [Globisporangium splendens]